MPEPDGPVDKAVSAFPVTEVARPARFTLMAPGKASRPCWASSVRVRVVFCRQAVSSPVAFRFGIGLPG